MKIVICDTFYEALAMQAAAIEAAVPEMPEHRFSLRYKRKKKALIKAYEKSKEKNTDIHVEFGKIRSKQRLRFALLIIVLSIVMTGALGCIVFYWGGIRVEKHNGYSRFEYDGEDIESAPKTLYPSYYLTADMSGWDKEINEDSEEKHIETYRNDNKTVIFRYTDYWLYQEEYPKFNTEELRTQTNGSETHITIHKEFGGELPRFMHTDDNYIYELLYDGISKEDARALFDTIKPLRYQITYDLSDWVKDPDFGADDRCFINSTIYDRGEETIYFEVCIKEIFNGLEISYDSVEVKNAYVNGYEALCYFYSGGGYTIFWDNGDYIFKLTSDLPFETGLEVAESIKQIIG